MTDTASPRETTEVTGRAMKIGFDHTRPRTSPWAFSVAPIPFRPSIRSSPAWTILPRRSRSHPLTHSMTSVTSFLWSEESPTGSQAVVLGTLLRNLRRGCGKICRPAPTNHGHGLGGRAERAGSQHRRYFEPTRGAYGRTELPGGVRQPRHHAIAS